ncbi:MAG: transposase [Gammaproteobacteria bacterium]|nr:transposase [Gammaproteobacteria bacterium]
MGTKKRRQYTAEFKREAIELAMSSGQSIVGTTKDLGIATSVLHRWKRDLEEHGSQAFVRQGQALRCSTDGAAPRVGAGEQRNRVF